MPMAGQRVNTSQMLDVNVNFFDNRKPSIFYYSTVARRSGPISISLSEKKSRIHLQY